MSRKCGLYSGWYIFLNILLLVIAFWGQDNFDVVTWTSILQLITILATIILYKKDYMLVSVLFIVFTYLFHFGQSLITTFYETDRYAHRNVMSKTTFEIYIEAELFAMTCLFFVGLGFMLANRRSKYIEQKKSMGVDFDDKKLKRIRQAGIIVFLISILPLIYIDVEKIIALKYGSYLDTYSVYAAGFEKYLYVIGQFARPAITIILFSYTKNKKRANVVLIMSTIYFVIMMLSGDRGTNLIYIITNFFVYFKFVRKLRTREIVIGAVGCYLGLAFLSAISLFRTSEFSLESLIEVLSRRSSDGIIYSVLREFGVSLLSLVYAIEFIPSYADYNYGFTYLASLLNILPKIPNSLAETLMESYSFVRAFPEAYQEALGGSFLGELYYNFGWFGTAMATFLGFFVGKVDLGLENLKEPKYIAMLLVMVPTIILWVRDYFCSIVFKSFWFSLLLLVF